MEPKKEPRRLEKLKLMLSNAEKRNEPLIVKLCKEILPTVNTEMTHDMFDNAIIEKINALAISATTLFKKKEKTIAEQEIYCISLLSYCFFDRRLEVSIDKKKVTIIDKRF